MDWFKKHADAVVVLTAIIGSMVWMNGKFNGIDRRFHQVDTEIITVRSDMNQRFLKVDNEIMGIKNEMNQRFSGVEKEIAVVKTIMIMKNIMPAELAHANKIQTEE